MSTRYPNANFKLLLRKGIFPYEYFDSFEKFEEPQLPPRESFFSTLRQEECSEEDYAYANQVWTAFGCNSLEDYLKLYLASDVCLLADVAKTSADFATRTTSSTRPTSSRLPSSRGTQCSKCRALSSSSSATQKFIE